MHVFFNHVMPSPGQMCSMLFCPFLRIFVRSAFIPSCKTLHLFIQLCYSWMHFFPIKLFVICIRRAFSEKRRVKNKQTKEQRKRNSLTWARWRADSATLSGQRSPRHELAEPWSLLGPCTTTWWTLHSVVNAELCFLPPPLPPPPPTHPFTHFFFFFFFFSFYPEGFIPFPSPRLSSHWSPKELEKRKNWLEGK